MRTSRLVSSAAALVFFLPALALATTWHVDPYGTGDAPTIQAGIDSAAAGDTIALAEGVYTGPGNKNLDFAGKPILLNSLNGPETTVIDCEGVGRGLHFHSGEGYDCRVQGLGIRNGVAPDGESPLGGGGIRVEGASPWIEACVLEGCGADSAHGYGGGILVTGHAFPRLDECRLNDNRAFGGGGGAWKEGAGIDERTRGLEIRGNRASRGGGVYAEDALYLVLCVLTGNYATDSGGGLYGRTVQGTDYYAWIDSCTVSGNRAGDKGGGVCVEMGECGDLYFVRSIHWGDEAPIGAEFRFESLCGVVQIICADLAPDGVSCPSTYVTYHDSIQQPPLFCGPMAASDAPTVDGDYMLDASSPCLEVSVCGAIGALGVGCDVFTSVAQGGSMPARPFGLSVSPNPSGGEVSLHYSRSIGSAASVLVYDIRGRVIRSLVAEGPSGVLTWDGRSESGRAVAPGVYFVRLQDGDRTLTKRLTLVR